MFDHERVIIERGRRSGLPIVVAVHSTSLGQAIGGCRFAEYPDWRDALTDALRLSAAMSDKSALAGLPNGGGKTVVAGPPEARTEALLDAGDLIASLGGTYATGPDVGTGPDDMRLISTRTPHVFCRPRSEGGSGDSSVHTAIGVIAALRAVCAERFGTPDLSARSFALLGVGHVGAHLAEALLDAGATLTVSDVDPSRRVEGAKWVTPDECLTADADVLIPAALGGLLTPAVVPRLRCAAIAGPANNQLDDPGTALDLHRAGILWAPDVVVSAGGIIHAVGQELLHLSPAGIDARLAGIEERLTEIFHDARAAAITPAEAARRRALALIAAGADRPASPRR